MKSFLSLYKFLNLNGGYSVIFICITCELVFISFYLVIYKVKLTINTNIKIHLVIYVIDWEILKEFLEIIITSLDYKIFKYFENTDRN